MKIKKPRKMKKPRSFVRLDAQTRRTSMRHKNERRALEKSKKIEQE